MGKVGSVVLSLSVTLGCFGSPTTATAAPGARTFYCFGKSATIVGTRGDDDITGTTGSDVIVARGGDDRIRGEENPYEPDAPQYGEGDFICGGRGVDDVDGYWGDDYIRGQLGGDYLSGDMGNDHVAGGWGNDGLEDDFHYEEDEDVLRGGPGQDRMGVAEGEDKVFAGRGKDLVTDGDCHYTDRLRGGRGDDQFRSYQSGFAGGRCSDWLPADQRPPDYIHGGEGADAARSDSNDRHFNVESVTIE
jgi:Ca2+-binding RTX toxin-like protein